jgi:hypothetical protein
VIASARSRMLRSGLRGNNNCDGGREAECGGRAKVAGLSRRAGDPHFPAPFRTFQVCHKKPALAALLFLIVGIVAVELIDRQMISP